MSGVDTWALDTGDGSVERAMDVVRFCRQAHVAIVAGKGGVGKTTVAAALALAAARTGLSVMLLGLADGEAFPALFGVTAPLTSADTLLYESPAGGTVRGRLLLADEALLDYLAGHGLGRFARRLISTGVLDVVSTAIPGIREVLVLGKLKQLERADEADLFVLDAPATGHAMRFLTSSSGLMDAARGGPLRSQAEQVVDLLSDATRCQVLLVTIPEETPVNEVIETAFRVEDDMGVSLGPVIVNDCYPHLELTEGVATAATRAGVAADAALLDRVARAATFRRAHEQVQRQQLARLDHDLPLPQLRLPHLFVPGIDTGALEELTDALERAIGALP